MDAALHADFGGAAIPRFPDAALDLVAVEVVGRAAQGVAELALGESAERAASTSFLIAASPFVRSQPRSGRPF
jgi:hypothetical protein